VIKGSPKTGGSQVVGVRSMLIGALNGRRTPWRRRGQERNVERLPRLSHTGEVGNERPNKVLWPTGRGDRLA
jgi:hypothetical protein